MPASHAPVISQEKTPAALRKLTDFFAERRRAGRPAPDFEAFERELHALVAAVECEGLQEELERQDVNVPVVVIGGVAYRQVVRCEDTYFAPAGPVRVMRSLYSARSESGETPLCPLELRAGIVEGRWTPTAAKQALWFVAQLPPQSGEELYQRLGGLTPSKTALDRLPKKFSAVWEGRREELEAALREQERVPDEAAAVGASLDGVMVPMKDGERQRKREAAAKEGKRTRGPAGHQEVGVGTLSFYDKAGNLLSTIRMGRMPEPKKATLKEMLAAELAAVVKQRPDLTVVRLADGAKDNWTFLDTLPVEGPRVVDFFHAAEHLAKALNAAYGENSPQAKAQLEKLRHVLRHDDDGVAKVIRALIHLRDTHPRSNILKTELKYFRQRRKLMRYAELATSGLPIGTGVTEAACKTLATQRLKCSGMAWREEGGQAILTLRSLIQSARFDGGWTLFAGTYRTAVETPENVIPLRGRMAA